MSNIKIPENLKVKVSSFREYSMGVNKVVLILEDGKIIKDVYLAWGNEIVKIGETKIESDTDLHFSIDHIADVQEDI